MTQKLFAAYCSADPNTHLLHACFLLATHNDVSRKYTFDAITMETNNTKCSLCNIHTPAGMPTVSESIVNGN